MVLPRSLLVTAILAGPLAAQATANAQDTTAVQHTVAQDTAGAYLDRDARELVRLARARRATVDRRIEAYQTTVRERFTVSLRAGVAEKMLYRRETSMRIDWERDGAVRLDVLGMRELAPIADSDPAAPFDVSAEILGLAFDPADADMLLRLEGTNIGHPLKAGSESSYRFAAGDTSAIRLPDGRTVELYELRVVPRVRRPDLFTGSLWLDARSHGVVRAQMRPARPFDGERDVTIDSDPDGGFLKPLLAKQLIGLMQPLELDIDFLTIEYGLWDLEWWLPRLAVARGVARVGRFTVPVAYERSYADYAVRGDAMAELTLREEADSTAACRATVRFVTAGDTTATDTMRQARADSEMTRRARLQGDAAPAVPCPRDYMITSPADSLLVDGPGLPPDPFAGEFELIDAFELQEIVARVRSLDPPPWDVRRPVLQWGMQGAGLTRYNRVEGVSTGVRLLFGAGPLRLRPELRYGFADRQVRGELGIEYNGAAIDGRLAAYRRLPSAMPSEHLHGTAASLGALVFGRDEHEYYDARGAELALRPGVTRRQWFDARVYAERQSPVTQKTDFSVARLLDTDRAFQPNFTADPADQFGAALALGYSLGTFPARLRVDGELSVSAETGDYRFVRREALLRVLAPLPHRLSVIGEAAAGTIDGAPPAQALWRLGGASTLRGYPTGSLVGDRYWRARAELGLGVGGPFGLSFFTDIAGIEPRGGIASAVVRRSWGLGIVPFGGLLRIDLARGLDTDGAWRVHLQVNREFED